MAVPFSSKSTPSRTRVALGDFNGDEWLDILVYFYVPAPQEPSTVYLNDQHGGFNDTLTRTLDTTPYAIAAAMGDLDGDGSLDIVIAASPTTAPNVGGNIIYSNDGQGNFKRTKNFLSSEGIGAGVALGDVDGDGKLDIVISNQ